MRQLFKYGFFRGMDPVCPERVRQYPDLAEVATALREGRKVDPEDLKDLQHQWCYSTSTRVMQSCFEEGCDAVRPVPMDGYDGSDQVFILRTFMNHKGIKETS